MAGTTEIAYTGLVDTHKALEPEFRLRSDAHVNGARASNGRTSRPRAAARR
jgi:hypothetical protein